HLMTKCIIFSEDPTVSQPSPWICHPPHPLPLPCFSRVSPLAPLSICLFLTGSNCPSHHCPSLSPLTLYCLSFFLIYTHTHTHTHTHSSHSHTHTLNTHTAHTHYGPHTPQLWSSSDGSHTHPWQPLTQQRQKYTQCYTFGATLYVRAVLSP